MRIVEIAQHRFLVQVVSYLRSGVGENYWRGGEGYDIGRWERGIVEAPKHSNNQSIR